MFEAVRKVSSMPTHPPIAAPQLVRFAHIIGIARKAKVAQGEAAKPCAPRPPQQSTRAQAATPAPAGGFLHLNANLPPARPQAMAAQRATEPTKQELVAQVLAAGKPGAAPAPRTKAEKIAAGVLATARKLQPGRF